MRLSISKTVRERLSISQSAKINFARRVFFDSPPDCISGGQIKIKKREGIKMKGINIFKAKLALACLVILTGCVSVFAQKTLDAGDFGSGNTLAEEMRPFDFSDRYYYENGVLPNTFASRRNGSDGLSVIDKTTDERFRDVRLTGVFPAYAGSDGKMIFWNLYGEIYKHSFRSGTAGDEALTQAEYHPMFIFPSDFVRNRVRQASVIDFKDNYFEKNPLGLSVQVEVRYTQRAFSDDGQRDLEILARRNGLSLDGTPIIKTAEEINDLTRKGLITQVIKGLNNPSVIPSYAVGKVVRNPERGALTPDSFLVTIQQVDGERFHADSLFLEHFDCLKNPECGR